MGKVIADHSISLDGFSTGPNVGTDNPMGDGGEELHAWQFRGGRRREVLDHLFGSSTGAVVVGRVSPPSRMCTRWNCSSSRPASRSSARG